MSGAAAGAGHAVQVDVVRHFAVGAVLKMELDIIALADADELAGDFSAEGPEGIADAIRQPAFDFLDLEIDDHLGGMGALNRRRNQRGVSQDGMLLALDFGQIGCLVCFCAPIVGGSGLLLAGRQAQTQAQGEQGMAADFDKRGTQAVSGRWAAIN